MHTRLVACVTAFALGTSSLAAPTPARAQSGDMFARMPSDDAVVLKDGTTLRGRIIERVKGDYLIIRTDEGMVRRVAWKDLQPEPRERHTNATTSNDWMIVPAALSLAAVVGGLATVVTSFTISDDDGRARAQRVGGIVLGGGLLGIVVLGAIALSQTAAAWK